MSTELSFGPLTTRKALRCWRGSREEQWLKVHRTSEERSSGDYWVMESRVQLSDGREVGVSLFSLLSATNDRTRGNGLKLHQERFMLYIRKIFFIESVTKYWKKLSREVVDSPSLKVLKRYMHVVHRIMVYW